MGERINSKWFTITIIVCVGRGNRKCDVILFCGSMKKVGEPLGQAILHLQTKVQEKVFEAKTMGSWKKHAELSILFFTPFSLSLSLYLFPPYHSSWMKFRKFHLWEILRFVENENNFTVLIWISSYIYFFSVV